ncbi:MAG: hypothetical protein Q8R02_13315 [Hyphomonadaceae bacterium]|nr:hypothetical protein [Hyphomonadaceae bacterium]
MKAFLRFLAFIALAIGLGMPMAAQQPAPATPVEQPLPASTGPSTVKIGLYINDIQSIDLHNYSYVADVYVWFRDSDPAIVPGSSFEWMNMFAPDDHVQTATYDVPQPQPDGSEYQVFRHQGPFAAKFSILTYPFDNHKLTIEIEDQEWDAGRLVYAVDEIAMNHNIELPGFIIGKPTLEIVNKPYPTAFGDLANPTAAPYSRAIVSIPISRPILSGITKALLPVFIVVLVAAAALLLSPSHVEARVGLSITALLTLVALQFSAMAGLPEVGYLLMIDQVYLASYGFVLLVVALLVMTTRQEDKVQDSGAQDSGADVVARGGPLTALLAVLLYAAIIGVVLWANLDYAARAAV